MILSISKNKYPLCPDPSKIHLSQVFADRLATLVEWIKFQPRIGAPIDASHWIQNYSEKQTEDRVISELETEQSNAENDLVLPPALEEMNKFREFDESFKEYLRHTRGVTKAPLLYLIREKEAVTDIQRNL